MRYTVTPSHIRKPILIGIAALFFLLLTHLIWVYVYMWWHYVWLPGGSTSIAIIGGGPDMMNPLSYGKNPVDEIVYPFIYKGLIRYNSEDNTAHENLAQCDISKIEKITCTLKKDIYWSDGTEIKEADVIATFRAFAELWENPNTKEVLRDTRIEAKNGVITFLNPDKDINILRLLTYPIYRSDMVEQAKTWRFSSGGHITTGQYTFSEQVEDTEYMHNRISLTKNEKTSGQKAWFDKIHFKFFENATTLKSAEDTLGIIIPPLRNTWIAYSERFGTYNYTTYEYFSVFFQTDRLSKNLRNSLHWQIGTSFSWQIEENHRAITNIFKGQSPILPQWNIWNFADIMKKNGFMKKNDWISSIESIPTTITGWIIYDKPRFFKNKQNSNVLFLNDATWWVLLTGNIDASVTSVIINWYQLKEFRAGNKNFSYRVSVEDETIKEWKNTYLLEWRIWDTGTSTGEILTLYYTKDAAKMAEYKKAVDDEYLARNNTPALVAEREREKAKQIEKANTLDPLYYYNKEWEEFKVTVAYITWPQSTESYAKIVEDSLKRLSIKTELIALDPKSLQDMILSWKKDYDIIIAWISAGETLSEIWQLFDPSKAWKWINLANIEIPKLATLFWDLRSATLSGQIDTIVTDILKIMGEESFFFPISSPIHTLYIDRNLKGIRSIPVISWPKAIYDILEFASIRDEYVFNTQDKSVLWFFWWVWNLLF